MNKITPNLNFTKKLAIYTLVTNFDEYKEMVESAYNAGFTNERVEFYYFDNLKNEFDGYSGINYALKKSTEEFIIFCHQDILFKFDKYEKLLECIENINNIDPNWSVLGNAGKDINGAFKVRISDPHGNNQSRGPFPAKVISLDENFLIINNKYNVSCSNQLAGFHFYGLDLCTNAIHLGLSCYVIDFHLQHKSSGSLNEQFYESKSNYIEMQRLRLNKNYFSTTCSELYVSNNKYFNCLINKKFFMRIYIFLRKNILIWCK